MDLALHTGAQSAVQRRERLSILLQFATQLTSLTVSRARKGKVDVCQLTSALTSLLLPRVTALTLLHLPLYTMQVNQPWLQECVPCLTDLTISYDHVLWPPVQSLPHLNFSRFLQAVTRIVWSPSQESKMCLHVAPHLLALREVCGMVLNSKEDDRLLLDVLVGRNVSLDNLTVDRYCSSLARYALLKFSSIRELNLIGYAVMPFMELPETPLANMRRITIEDHCINCDDFVQFFRKCCNLCVNLEAISVDSLATLSQADLRRIGKQLKRRTSISLVRIVTSYKASTWALAQRLQQRRCARIVLEARPDSDGDSDESSGV